MSDWQPAIIAPPNSHGALRADLWPGQAGKKIRVRPAIPSNFVLAQGRSFGCDATELEWAEVHPDDVAMLRPDMGRGVQVLACKHYFLTD